MKRTAKMLSIPVVVILWMAMILMSGCGGGNGTTGQNSQGGSSSGGGTQNQALTLSCPNSVIVETQITCTTNSSTAATWSVEGTQGGSVALGLIANGTYTAPSTVPQSDTVTISVANASGSAQKTVTVNPSPHKDDYLTVKVVQNGSTYTTTLYANSPDGQTKTALLSQTANGYTVDMATWTPGHSWAAYVAYGPGQNEKHIAIVPAYQVGTPVQVTPTTTDWIGGPVFSRDGQKLYFSHAQNGVTHYFVQSFTPGSTTIPNAQQVANVIPNNTMSFCSGTTALYPDPNGVIQSYNTTTGTITATGVHGSSVACSPDGKYLLLQGVSDPWNSYTCTFDGTNCSNTQEVANVGGGAWSMDGKWFLGLYDSSNGPQGDIQKYAFPFNTLTAVTLDHPGANEAYFPGAWF